MISEQRFPNALESVTKARHYAVDVLAGFPSSLVNSAELIVSELATNCLRHARTGFNVGIVVDDSGVRISVTDSGSGAPTLKSPVPSDTSGRGLQIVDLLATEWGVVPASAAHGKTVWFQLRVGSDSEAL